MQFVQVGKELREVAKMSREPWDLTTGNNASSSSISSSNAMERGRVMRPKMAFEYIVSQQSDLSRKTTAIFFYMALK